MGGWLKDKFDGRDHPFTSSIIVKDGSAINLRDKLNIRWWNKEIYDQGNLGSCVANATAAAYYYELQRQLAMGRLNWGSFAPSRLFIYWTARTAADRKGKGKLASACCIRNAMKGLEQYGVCKEATWPYLEEKVDIYPGRPAYDEAAGARILKYERLDVHRIRDPSKPLDTPEKDKVGLELLNNLRTSLFEAHPVVFNFHFNDDDWRANGPERLWILNALPERHVQRSDAEGHAVVAVGFDDKKRLVRCLNSWGPKAEMKPIFWIPYDWITDYEATADFWMLRLVDTSGTPKL